MVCSSWELLVLTQRGLGTRQAGALPWPEGTSRPSCPCPLLPSRRGVQRAALKKCTFWPSTTRKGLERDAMPGRASPLHALPGAADTEARPGHLPSSKPRGPLRMRLCLAPLLHPKSRGGRGCRGCAGGAEPRLNRLSLSHRKSGQKSGTSERHRHAAGRAGGRCQ